MHTAPTPNLSKRPRAASRRPSPKQHIGAQQTVQCKLVAIPVRLDQTPGEVSWFDGACVDIAGSSLSLTMDRVDPLPVNQIVIGASLPNQMGNAQRKYLTARIESQQRIDGVLRIDAFQVKDSDEDFLSERNLAPRINPNKLRFENGCNDEVLQQWESLGVLRQYLVDRVLVCPSCESIPTWRYACPKCGSARYSRDRLIHHFACAHVDHAESFQTNDAGLQCPKCQTPGLIAGTDFQIVGGPLTCFDCNDRGGQPNLWCMCHQCLNRFEPGEATELELHGYHVDRLELLDLVVAPE